MGSIPMKRLVGIVLKTDYGRFKKLNWITFFSGKGNFDLCVG
jgi:hypothetical protein